MAVTMNGGPLRLKVVGSKGEAAALGDAVTGYDGVFVMPAPSRAALRKARRLRRWEERSDKIDLVLGAAPADAGITPGKRPAATD